MPVTGLSSSLLDLNLIRLRYYLSNISLQKKLNRNWNLRNIDYFGKNPRNYELAEYAANHGDEKALGSIIDLIYSQLNSFMCSYIAMYRQSFI